MSYQSPGENSVEDSNVRKHPPLQRAAAMGRVFLHQSANAMLSCWDLASSHRLIPIAQLISGVDAQRRGMHSLMAVCTYPKRRFIDEKEYSVDQGWYDWTWHANHPGVEGSQPTESTAMVLGSGGCYEELSIRMWGLCLLCVDSLWERTTGLTVRNTEKNTAAVLGWGSC